MCIRDRSQGGHVGRVGQVSRPRFGADAVNGAQLSGQRPQTLLAPGDERKVEAGRGQLPGERLADAGRRAGDDRPAARQGDLARRSRTARRQPALPQHGRAAHCQAAE